MSGGPPPDGRPKVPAVPGVDVLIVESTYGINNHDPREKREKGFLTAVRSCTDR